MKQLRRGFAVLAALALLSSPVMAHNGRNHKRVLSLAAEENAGAIPQQSPTVAIQTFQFKPAKLEVKTGTKVTWTNQDDIRHTVTSGAPEKKDGRFDAPLAGKGTGFSFAFTEPGTYPYFCDRHQHMRGEIQAK